MIGIFESDKVHGGSSKLHCHLTAVASRRKSRLWRDRLPATQFSTAASSKVLFLLGLDIGPFDLDVVVAVSWPSRLLAPFVARIINVGRPHEVNSQHLYPCRSNCCLTCAILLFTALLHGNIRPLHQSPCHDSRARSFFVSCSGSFRSTSGGIVRSTGTVRRLSGLDRSIPPTTKIPTASTYNRAVDGEVYSPVSNHAFELDWNRLARYPSRRSLKEKKGRPAHHRSA